nr:autotransporter domain-containing protein [Amorphus coralli]
MRFTHYSDFGPFYAKPIIDIVAAYTHAPAFNESGAGIWNLHYDSQGDAQVAFSPSLEIGRRIDLGIGVLRAYARAGLTYWNDNDWSRDVTFEGMAAGDAGHANVFDGNEFYGRGTLGAELISTRSLAMRFEYQTRATTTS